MADVTVKKTILDIILIEVVFIGISMQLSLANQRFCPDQGTAEDPSTPRIGNYSSSEEEEQYSGRSFAIKCCVSGNPVPDIVWQKDGQSLPQHFMSRTYELKENRQVLDIRQVLPQDSGNFTCNANNKHGNANLTVDFYVFVIEPDHQPNVHLPQTQWTVKRDGNITLQCEVTGSYSRPVITWLRETSNNSRSWIRKNGTEQTVSRSKDQRNKWFSNLTIHAVKPEDAGTYICRAKNGLGQGTPSEATRYLTVTKGDGSRTGRVGSTSSPPVALNWGLVTFGVVAVALLAGGTSWFLVKTRRKSYTNIPGRCPATEHGENGDDDCVCQVKFDVFISFNSNDKDWVNGVLRERLSERYRVCMDCAHFQPGKYITDNIVHNIWVSRKILLVLTKNFLKSEWCCFEKQIAQGKVVLCKDSLIVIMLENLKLTELPKDLRHYKLKKTCLEWDNDDVKPHFWKRLIDAIGPSSFPQDIGEENV